MRNVKRRSGKLFVVMIAFFVTLSTFCFSGQAAQAEDLLFGAQPVGKNTDKGYFELNVQAGKDYELPVELTNKTKQPITIQVTPLNALTSIYGNIQYVPFEEGNYTNLTDKSRALSKYLSVNDVKLKPKEKKIVTFKVHAPDKAGVLLGGLSFKTDQPSESKENADKKTSFAIKNRVDRIIGVQLNYDQKEEMSITAKQPKVMITPSGAFLMMNLKNNQGTITNDVTMKYRVSDANNKELFNGDVKSFTMAPTSEIGYPAVWDSKKLEAGVYKLNLLVKTPNQTINEDFNFKVTNANTDSYAETVNPTVVNPSIWDYPWLLILIIALLMIIIVLLLFLIIRKKKKQESKPSNEDPVNQTSFNTIQGK